MKRGKSGIGIQTRTQRPPAIFPTIDIFEIVVGDPVKILAKAEEILR